MTRLIRSGRIRELRIDSRVLIDAEQADAVCRAMENTLLDKTKLAEATGLSPGQIGRIIKAAGIAPAGGGARKLYDLNRVQMEIEKRMKGTRNRGRTER